jgi:hypothetical protein
LVVPIPERRGRGKEDDRERRGVSLATRPAWYDAQLFVARQGPQRDFL